MNRLDHLFHVVAYAEECRSFNDITQYLRLSRVNWHIIFYGVGGLTRGHTSSPPYILNDAQWRILTIKYGILCRLMMFDLGTYVPSRRQRHSSDR